MLHNVSWEQLEEIDSSLEDFPGLKLLRALTPLIWAHVNPYGTFRLDLVNDRNWIQFESGESQNFLRILLCKDSSGCVMD